MKSIAICLKLLNITRIDENESVLQDNLASLKIVVNLPFPT